MKAWHHPKAPLALTFDDGPDPVLTPLVLDRDPDSRARVGDAGRLRRV
jgi:hypothetical protein